MNMTIGKNHSLAGLQFQQSLILQGSSALAMEIQVAGAKSGTLTVRTDNTTGTLTMAAGHGITTGAIIDLYWTGGSRRTVTVGTVSGNSVPFSIGSGDNLPIATTPITASVQVSYPFVFTGNSIIGAAFFTASKGTFIVAPSGGSENYARVLAAGGVSAWYNGDGTTNPFAGQSNTQVFMTQGGVAVAVMRIAVLYP